jgi:hypothetical protein
MSQMQLLKFTAWRAAVRLSIVAMGAAGALLIADAAQAQDRLVNP